MHKTTVDVVIDSDVDTVWNVLTDWSRQSDWMWATKVDAARSGGPHGVGETFTAVTGVGRLAVVDEMVVTAWEPPRRVDVSHVGKVIQGTGVFEVYRLPENRARVSWTEYIDIPLGSLGRASWPLVRLGFEWGARRSLQALRRIIEANN
jgi:hypothetical protein